VGSEERAFNHASYCRGVSVVDGAGRVRWRWRGLHVPRAVTWSWIFLGRRVHVVCVRCRRKERRADSLQHRSKLFFGWGRQHRRWRRELADQPPVVDRRRSIDRRGFFLSPGDRFPRSSVRPRPLWRRRRNTLAAKIPAEERSASRACYPAGVGPRIAIADGPGGALVAVNGREAAPR
jgi:hypothetical protein